MADYEREKGVNIIQWLACLRYKYDTRIDEIPKRRAQIMNHHYLSGNDFKCPIFILSSSMSSNVKFNPAPIPIPIPNPCNGHTLSNMHAVPIQQIVKCSQAESQRRFPCLSHFILSLPAFSPPPSPSLRFQPFICINHARLDPPVTCTSKSRKALTALSRSSTTTTPYLLLRFAAADIAEDAVIVAFEFGFEAAAARASFGVVPMEIIPAFRAELRRRWVGAVG